MPTLLITGAEGFIGAHVFEVFSQYSDWRVVRTTRPGSDESPDRVAVALDDVEALGRAIARARPDHVLHLAGGAKGTPDAVYRNNLMTVVTVAEATLANAPGAIVTALGSAAEYGALQSTAPIHDDAPPLPTGAYGLAKAAAAQYLACAAQRGLRYNWVRVFNPVAVRNPPTLVIGAFIERAIAVLRQPPPRRVQMGPLGAVRDFVAMSDLVRLLEKLVVAGIHGQTVNAATGRGLSIRAVIDIICAHAGADIEIIEGQSDGPRSTSIVGDPKKFLALAELSAPTKIEGVLAAAWDSAIRPRP